MDSKNNQIQELILIDAHALIYRAYYAFPDLTTQDGTLVNAVYGFSKILLKVLTVHQPDYIAIAFDHKHKTFRQKSYEKYKANRPEMPDDLKPQIDLVKQVVDAFNIPRFEIAGYEADDLIATICAQMQKNQLVLSQKIKILIVTGDKDLLQLVTDDIHVLIPARSQNRSDIEYDPAMVKQMLGVYPNQVVELKALMGDASDNIPGIKGIGPKTALKLLHQFGSLAGLYKSLAKTVNLDTFKLKDTLIQKLKQGKPSALLSKELATINSQAPLKFDLASCRLSDYNKQDVWHLFSKLNFDSLMELLPTDDFEVSLKQALF